METSDGAGSAHLGGHLSPGRLLKDRHLERRCPGSEAARAPSGQAYLEIMSFLCGRRCCSGSPGEREEAEEGIMARE